MSDWSQGPIFPLICLFLLAPSVSAEQAASRAGDLETALDPVFAKHARQVPGAAIVAVQDGAVILEKGYGFKDLSSGNGSHAISSLDAHRGL